MTTLAPLAPPAHRRANHTSVSRRLTSVAKHLLLIVVAVTMIYPLLWLIWSSFRANGEIFKNTWLLPLPDFGNLTNFATGFTSFQQMTGYTYPFAHFFLNTLIITVGCVIGNLATCSLAAYAFARQKFRGRSVMFAVMLLTVMLPGHVVLIPQYIIWNKLGLINTFVPLILPKFLAVDAFYTFLMVQFIRGIPSELDESARIDGANHWRIFSRIMLPLMVPAMATTAIFTFIGVWNDFFSQLIYLTDPKKWTVAIGVKGFIDSETGSNYGATFAMSLLSIVPLFLIFLFGQKYLVKGIAMTGFK
ncbi:MAG: carbohydrate ABC transporter permease [Propionibacteriaceae bacterium]|nr:carbohydrate ABC transporter permease [Propionibacteriaceae bacterium]